MNKLITKAKERIETDIHAEMGQAQREEYDKHFRGVLTDDTSSDSSDVDDETKEILKFRYDKRKEELSEQLDDLQKKEGFAGMLVSCCKSKKDGPKNQVSEMELALNGEDHR